MAVPLYTISTFNQQKYMPLGAIFGKRIEAISLFRGFAAGFQGLFGGQIGMVEKKIQDAMEGAKADLLKQAQLMYPQAQAVIGLQIHITDVGRDDKTQFILATAQGTVIGPRESIQIAGKRRTSKGTRRR